MIVYYTIVLTIASAAASQSSSSLALKRSSISSISLSKHLGAKGKRYAQMWKVTVHTPKYRHTQQSKRNQTKVSTSWSLHCIITSSSLQVRCSDSRNTHTHQRARQDTCTSVLADIYVELGLHTHVWSGRICIRLFAPLQCKWCTCITIQKYIQVRTYVRTCFLHDLKLH